jgi:spoIIIJ-associated protein
MNSETKSIEMEAATVEAAITKGLAQLGVSSDQVRIEVLNEGSRGLLGLGARDAQVRLTLLSPPAPEAADISDGDHAPAPQIKEEPAEPEPVAEPEPELKAPTPVPTATIAQEVLGELLQLMGVQAEVEIRDDKDAPTGPDAPPFVLDVLGNDLGVLIGRKGKTLHALQFMTRLIVSREVGKWVRLVVDVEKYKVRREKQLEQLADRLAERVVLTQQPVALEPMPPNERRIIHVTLREHPIVTTESVGQGERRRVTILPKS